MIIKKMACPSDFPFTCDSSASCYQTVNDCAAECAAFGQAAQCGTNAPTVPRPTVPPFLAPPPTVQPPVAAPTGCPSSAPLTCANSQFCYASLTECAAACAAFGQSGQCGASGLPTTTLIAIIVPSVVVALALLVSLFRFLTKKPNPGDNGTVLAGSTMVA